MVGQNLTGGAGVAVIWGPRVLGTPHPHIASEFGMGVPIMPGGLGIPVGPKVLGIWGPLITDSSWTIVLYALILAGNEYYIEWCQAGVSHFHSAWLSTLARHSRSSVGQCM